MEELPRSTMKTSIHGLADLERREGKRSKVYFDSTGKPTIGVGHLLIPPFNKDMEWSEDEIKINLALDVKLTEDYINYVITSPLSQPQFDSLVSFVFNIGRVAFGSSTLCKYLNDGWYRQAADQFLVWTKQHELLGRRLEERAVFLYGTAELS